MLSPDKQLETIKRGAVGIISEEDLLKNWTYDQAAQETRPFNSYL